MSTPASYSTEQSLIDFVSSFNNDKRYKGFPIVAFQFVSLNSVKEGKMVWWSFLHKEIQAKYLEALNDFTGITETGNVEKTLINWEYEEHSFWYDPFGCLTKDKIIKNAVTMQDFLPVISDDDKSGSEKKKADKKEKIKLLGQWKQLLNEKFEQKGSTMWVSIPHKDNRIDVVYSSVFCLFNCPLPERHQLSIARSIRNFIFDYIIDLYRSPLEKQVQLLSSTTEIEKFRPKKYNYTGKKKVDAIKKVNDHFYQQNYLDDFIREITNASDRLSKSYNTNDKKLNDPPKNIPTSYKPLHKIKTTTPKLFFQLVYGRLLFLSYLLVFDETISESYRLLTGKILDKTYIVDILGIDGLKKDDFGTSGTSEGICDPDRIVPCISDFEYEFLLQACVEFKEYIPGHKKASIETARGL